MGGVRGLVELGRAGKDRGEVEEVGVHRRVVASISGEKEEERGEGRDGSG